MLEVPVRSGRKISAGVREQLVARGDDTAQLAILLDALDAVALKCEGGSHQRKHEHDDAKLHF